MVDRVWFVTGISRGLGLALASAAIDAGDRVIGTTRDGSRPVELRSDALTVLPLEATDSASIEAVVGRAHALYGRIDVVVNNAGYGLIGPIEAVSQAEVEHQFAVNVFGPLTVIRAVLPILRKQGSGHIVNMSSVAAIAPAPGAGLYAASKSALWALSQSLAQEVAPFGIRTTVVSPGPFRTDFLSTHSVRHAGVGIEAYTSTAAGHAIDSLMLRAGAQVGDPARAAQAILRIVAAEEPPVDLLLGADALARVHSRLNRFNDDLVRWQDVSLGTDFQAELPDASADKHTIL